MSAKIQGKQSLTDEQSQNLTLESSQFPTIKEAEFQLKNEKGSQITVKLLMKEQFIQIHASLMSTFWNVTLSLNQAQAIHKVFGFDETVEDLFCHISDCFTSNQVTHESIDQLLHLKFEQKLGNRAISFKITLKEGQINISQTFQDIYSQIFTLKEQNMEEKQKLVTILERLTTIEQKQVIAEQKQVITEQKQATTEQKLASTEQKLAQTEQKLTETEQKYVATEQKVKKLEEIINQITALNSSIALNFDNNLIFDWVSQGKTKTVSHFDLLYRASTDGFQGQTFQQKCDGKGPLLCFVRSSNNRRFGGFIHLTFQKDKNDYVPANPNNSFIFSLDDKKQYLSNETNCPHAYYSHQSYGFTMGGGYDLYLSDNCNQSNSSYSYLGQTYGKNQGGSQTSLAGSKNFTVSEIEVFHVVYK